MTHKPKGEPQKRGQLNYFRAEQILRADGWFEVKTVHKSGTSHHHFRHKTKEGNLIVPQHKGKDLPSHIVDCIYGYINQDPKYIYKNRHN